jgi:hypothetical protein
MYNVLAPTVCTTSEINAVCGDNQIAVGEDKLLITEKRFRKLCRREDLTYVQARLECPEPAN